MEMPAAPEAGTGSSARGTLTQTKRTILAWPWLWAALLIQLASIVCAWMQDPLPVPVRPPDMTLSFWKPVEINPYRRLLPLPDSFNSVAFMPDGKKGWAVGTRGTIIATSDSGQTWHRQNSDTTDFLHTVFFVPDGKRGWAVGINGAIVATKNGGQSWTRQSSNTARTLTPLTFHAKGLLGWTGGELGTILATEDGGASWYAQKSNTQRRIDYLWFDSQGQRGVALADGGSARLTTENGGRNWAVAPVENSPFLAMAITLLADGTRGWAVGDLGTGALTLDGGQTWKEGGTVPGRNFNAYRGIAFNEDGLHGWAVGDAGAVVETVDGGASWKLKPIGTDTDLADVTFADDMLRGWIVGRDGMVLATTDGGRNWHRQTRTPDTAPVAQRYARYPAPWYLLVTALCSGLVWMAWRRRPLLAPKESIADVASSDAEVSGPDEDRLEFAGLARGISRFLRNTATQPPLTLAITGGWGTGKTSLMRLVCADLRRHGHRPIWFNAWHYQNEEHLFAALLGAVKTQGVPRLPAWEAISCRLRLLSLRSRRHLVIAVALIVMIVTFIAVAAAGFAGNGIVGMQDSLEYAKYWSAGLSVTATVTGLLAIVRGTELFGLDPALLLTRVRGSLSLETAVAQNDFRSHFAHDFRQLIDTLPHRLCIVIDDLDRCRPEAVLEVMETVNYLTSGGNCFVMFGMATERVQASIGLAFKDIAAELVQIEQNSPCTASAAGSVIGDPAMAKRRAYALDYLQKLVNIEIKVPTEQSDMVHSLLLAPNGTERQARIWRFPDIRPLWPAAATITALCAGIWLASLIIEDRRTATATAADAGPPVAEVIPSPGPNRVPDAAARPPAPNVSTEAPPAPEAPRSRAVEMLILSGIALIPVIIAAAAVLVFLFRADAPETHDSPRFRQALRIWAGVVAAKHKTPRSVKRFGNRIRYFAMLQQGDIQVKSTMQRFISYLTRRRTMRGITRTQTVHPHALDEAQLIAMGAIYELAGERWRDVVLGQWTVNGWVITADVLEAELAEIVNAAIGRHRQEFNTEWPPTAEEVAVFVRLIAGMHLSGDPRTLAPAQRPGGSAA